MLAGRLSLGKRITLLVVLGLAVVLSVFGFLSLHSLRQSSDRAIGERLMAAQLTAHHLDGLLDIYLEILSRGADPNVIDLDDPDPLPEKRLLEQLYGLRGGKGYAIFLVDRNGALIRAEPEAGRAGLADLDGGGIVGEVISTGTPRISNGYVDATGRRLISLVVPVWGRGGSPAGALVRVLDLADPLLAGFVDPVSLGETGYAELVDSRGMVLASSRASRLFQKSDHTDQFASLIQAGRPTAGVCHSCHEAGGANQVEPDVLAFAPLSRAPWGVAIRQSEAEALAPTRELQRSLALASLAALATVAGVVLLASRGVVSPVRGLIAASRRMAGGDLESTIRSGGPAEIGELAKAFDEMREKLRSSLSSLEQANSGLELRVEQRTRQLSALLEVSKVLASTLELRQLLAWVAARAHEVLEPADAGFVALHSERSGRLEVKASWGYGPAIAQLSVAPGEGLVGRVFQEGNPVLLDSAEAVREVRATLGVENRAWLALATAGLGPITHLISVPLAVKGRTIGAMMLAHHREGPAFTQSDLRIAQALAEQIAVAVENARLYQEVLEKERHRGQLLDKVIVAQEEERRRIARELHDDTCQSLAALAISLEEAGEGLPEGAREARSSLLRLKSRVQATLAGVRTLALNLRPSVLDDLGLTMAIDWYAREQVAGRGLEVRLEMDGVRSQLPPSTETVLFRIAQEALNNVAKHSGASVATVRLAAGDSRVVLEVEDDGLGFDVARTLGRGAPTRSLGLHGMIERAALSGGVLHVLSAPGRGTRIQVELPLQRAEGNGHEEDLCAAGG